MAPKSARIATKAKATEAESGINGPADTLDDELAELKVTLSTNYQDAMSQMHSIKAHCDVKVQTASTLKTVQADLQAAASITSALITQSTDPIQQRLDSLQPTVEQGECKRKSTSMIVGGFSPASVYQLLAQHASNQQFSITSVTVLGNPTDGSKSIRVLFSSTDDKHAAYTASKGLRPERIYLGDDLTPLQLQERQQLSHIHRQLRRRQLHPFWRGSVLFCKEEDGELKKYMPKEVANTPLATQQPYPRHIDFRERRPAAAAPNTIIGLAAASAAAAAAIAPHHGLTQPAAPQVATDPSTAAPPTEPATSVATSTRLPSSPTPAIPTAASAATHDAIAGAAAAVAAAAATTAVSLPATSGSTAAPSSATLPLNSGAQHFPGHLRQHSHLRILCFWLPCNRSI